MNYYKKLTIAVSIMLFGLVSSANVVAKIPANISNNPSISHMLKNVMPTVVNITVRGDVPMIPNSTQQPQQRGQSQSPLQHHGFLPPRKFESNGSGVIVDAKNGYIVTNAHVIRFGKVFIVTLNDGRMLKAKVVGIDNLTDIAVLQVNDKYLKDIPFSDSDKLEPGDFVAAIGNPFGLHQTVTSGVVSALNRSIGIEGPAGYENFIQTDASINPGNSGGALVNMNGKLVGINTAILAPMGGNIGIGFSIPSNMVKKVMDQLIHFHKIRRGMLGVMVQSLTPSLADAFGLSNTKGAVVTDIVPGSPAEIAGIKEGDIIETINDKPVKNAAQLRSVIGLLPVGEAAMMKLHRDHKVMTLTAVIDSVEKLKKQIEEKRSLLSGVRLNNFYQKDDANKEIKGVIVLDVQDNSNAWLAGLRPGDVILKANNHTMTDIHQLTSLDQRHPQKILLSIKRGRGNLFLVIT